MNFGEWLREQLKNQKITQLKLAQDLEVAPSAVSFWVNGINLPDESHWGSIARYFKVERSFIARLMGRVDDGDDHQFSPQMQAFMQRIDEILNNEPDPRKREFIISYLENGMVHIYAEAKDMLERLQDFSGEPPQPPA